MIPNYPESPLPIKSARYEDIPSLMTWISGFKPKRIVIVDFGAAVAVTKFLASVASEITDNVTVIAVGYEAKVYSF
jgi:hypothetical protein